MCLPMTDSQVGGVLLQSFTCFYQLHTFYLFKDAVGLVMEAGCLWRGSFGSMGSLANGNLLKNGEKNGLHLRFVRYTLDINTWY
jgi:hypothetical protein